MKLGLIFCETFLIGLICVASAQTPAPNSRKSDDNAQLEALAKKIDDQNAKIDALSQEILKLEQQLIDNRSALELASGCYMSSATTKPAN